MIRIRDIVMPPEHNPHQLGYEAAQLLGISASKIRQVKIVRRSVDARKKPDIRIIYTIDVTVDGNEKRILKLGGCKRAQLAPTSFYKPPKTDKQPEKRPVVIGFGPAGMFAALILANAGLRPIVLERGEDAPSRNAKVEHFFATGELDPRSNVQFGEGGAGTFSDGKLNTGVNNPRIGWILSQFVRFGARDNILYDAKPHVGTDVLLTVVQNLRARVIKLGGEVRFNTLVTGLMMDSEKLIGVKTADGEEIFCDTAVLAIGHSARDTFEMLDATGIPMEPKAFAMGVRIEHKQTLIDEAQYGRATPVLPPADYKLVQHLENATVYTFCMCPGGQVVAAASEAGGVVVNGMSLYARDGENANSALLVNVLPEDFGGDDPLAGVRFQQKWERAAFEAGGGDYRAPAQRAGDFLAHRPSDGPGKVTPSYRPGVKWGSLDGCLPEFVTDAMREALPLLDRKLKGFAHPDAVLTGVETRSSSPVRIERDADCLSNLRGLYPCGEGAGYAGGIMSAAVDGIRCAEAVILHSSFE